MKAPLLVVADAGIDQDRARRRADQQRMEREDEVPARRISEARHQPIGVGVEHVGRRLGQQEIEPEDRAFLLQHAVDADIANGKRLHRPSSSFSRRYP
jgi:hypothetical protein